MALRTSLVAQPHLYMGDTTGRPLDNGKVYFGEPNKDPEFYPINVFYDEELTIAAPQPVRSKGGFISANGNMAEIYAAETRYSVKVLDSYGRQVFYKPDMQSGLDVSDQINSISEMIALVGATTGQKVFVKGFQGGNFIYDSDKSSINDGVVNFNGWVRQIDGFITPLMAGAKGDGVTNDTVAFQKTVDYASDKKVTLELEGDYALRVVKSHTSNTGETSEIACVLIDKPINISSKSSKILVEGNKHGLWIASSDVSISGVSFDKLDGTARGTIGHTIRASSIRGKISNINIKNCRFDGFSDNSILYASVASSVIESCFFNDTVVNTGNSGDAYVELTNSTGCTVISNTFTKTPAHAIRVNGSKNCNIVNNYGENIGADVPWRTFIYLDGGSSGNMLLESRGNKVHGNIGINVQNGVRCGIGWNYDNAITNNHFEAKRHGVFSEAIREGIYIYPVAGGAAVKAYFDVFIDGLTITGNTIISEEQGIMIVEKGREAESPDITANKLVISGNYIRSKQVSINSSLLTRASVTNSSIVDNVCDVPSDIGTIFFNSITNSTVKNNTRLGSILRNTTTIYSGKETCDLGSVRVTEGYSASLSTSGNFRCKDLFNLILGTPCYLTKVEATDTLPAGYVENTIYYLTGFPGDSTKYRLAATMEAAISGSSVVKITAVNSGRFKLNFIH